MNNLLLDQTNFYWTLPHVRQTLGMTGTDNTFPKEKEQKDKQ
jgi:hypothetical protein